MKKFFLIILFALLGCTKNKSLFGSDTYTFPGLEDVSISSDGSLNLKWDDITKKNDELSNVKYQIFKRDTKTQNDFDWDDPFDLSDKNVYKVAAYKLNESYCFAVRYTISGKKDDSNTKEVCPNLVV